MNLELLTASVPRFLIFTLYSTISPGSVVVGFGIEIPFIVWVFTNASTSGMYASTAIATAKII